MKKLRQILKQGLENRIYNEDIFINDIVSKQEQVILDRLRQEYKESLGGSLDDRNYRRNRYSAVRVFCLDCELLTFEEIELMEFEVNQSFTS
jgi:hypothetical protein